LNLIQNKLILNSNIKKKMTKAYM